MSSRRDTSSRTLLRCQRVGRNRQKNAMSGATSRIARATQPPSRAKSGVAWSRPSAWIFSICRAVTRSPLRTTVSSLAIDSRTGATAAAAWATAWSVSAWSNEELASTSGASSSAASARSACDRPAPMRLGGWLRVPARSVSRSSARSSMSRTRPASDRIVVQRSGVRPWSVVTAGAERSSIAVASSCVRSSALRSPAKAASTASVRPVNARACWSARAAAFAGL